MKKRTIFFAVLSLLIIGIEKAEGQEALLSAEESVPAEGTPLPAEESVPAEGTPLLAEGPVPIEEALPAEEAPLPAGWPSISMGLWLEATSSNTFLTRDIATGKKEGFEFDRAAFKTKANWWVWAEFSPQFQLDTEIGLWDLDLPLYQANSYGANVPDTTWADGAQGVGSLFFAPVSEANSQTPGKLNKLGFTVSTPYVKGRVGYGLLKAGGMSHFTGIYNVIDRLDNVGRGYTELSLGPELQNIGDGITLNTLAGLSRTRAEYGFYSLVDLSFFERAEAALTLAGATNAPELFRYSEQNENAVSFYASYKILDNLKAAFHGLSSFGTDFDSGPNAGAVAAGISGETGPYKGELTLSRAGPDAKTVWGDDDSVIPDSLSAGLVQWFTINSGLKVGLDTNVSNYNTGDLGDGLVAMRNEPMVDVDVSTLIGLDMNLSLYGVVLLDRIAANLDAGRPWVSRFEEAGVELTLGGIAFWEKLVFDYAVLAEYQDWDGNYDRDTFYHSVMVNADITAALSVNMGTVIRLRENASDDRPLPLLGLAAGTSLKTGWKGFGSPRLWMHFTYGMDPYEDNNYSLFRYDDPSNRRVHRSYRLNHLDTAVDKSRIAFGFIWEL
ncbi:MAG: hypothetical protein LBT00_01065 [Spirochaetaceae bacterium]|jgi:hypothetical protein|nr:hypothetical protein [Spirochaetaceae bacterium]